VVYLNYQVNAAQFHELREEVLLLKESLKEERQERHRIGQQLAYEVEKSNIWYQQVNDLKLKLEDYKNEMETCKIQHEEEVNRLLQEVVQERKHRLRAETELRMEAAKLEDLCCTLEQWRDEDKHEWNQLQEQHIQHEVEWKGQVEQQKGEVEKLKKVVEKYCHNVDEFRKFLSSENIMISGLWAEQVANISNITERVESLNKVSETKSNEIAQLKQCVSECDEAITRQARGNCTLTSGK
jgi:chromosome segregation ATPase